MERFKIISKSGGLKFSSEAWNWNVLALAQDWFDDLKKQDIYTELFMMNNKKNS